MRKLVSAAVALSVALGVVGATQAAAKQEIAFTFSNINFVGTTVECPEGIITFDIATLQGERGSGSSCLKTFAGCTPFSVPCHQRATAVFSFDLSGRTYLVSAKLSEVVVDDDPFTLVQRAHGHLIGERGHLKGGGTLTFTAAGVQSTVVYVLRLGAAPEE
jgi:hypothetical protein